MIFIQDSQTIAKIIKYETAKQNKKLGKMLDECGLSKNAISSMNSGYYPQLENLVRIADYLGVSVDYLLGRSLPETEKAPDKIRSKIISNINRLSDHQLDVLLAYLEGMLSE